jgi:hypothetical protein
MKSAGRFQSGKTKITGTVPAKEVPPTLKNFRGFHEINLRHPRL